jgi:thioredoxin 1
LIVNVTTENELHELLDSHAKVVVDFSAPGWCVPCQRLAPHFSAASDKMSDVVFVEVDIDKAEDIRNAYGIQSVPYVVAFKDGNVVSEVKGRTAVALIEEIKRATA